MEAPKRRDDVKTWELDGEAVVYDNKSGMGHVLNPTALRIWSLCDGKRSTEEIEKLMVDSYPRSQQSIARDVRQTVQQLSEIGLVHIT